MTQIEDLVRSTTRALAGTVGTVRPLPALPQEPSLDEVSRRRSWRRAAPPAPLAAPAPAARLRAAQNAAADATAVRDAPGRQHVKRARGWLIPLAAAASVLAIVAAAAVIAFVVVQRHPSTGSGEGKTFAEA